MGCTAAESEPLLQVVADYTRLNAAQTQGVQATGKRRNRNILESGPLGLWPWRAEHRLVLARTDLWARSARPRRLRWPRPLQA